MAAGRKDRRCDPDRRDQNAVLTQEHERCMTSEGGFDERMDTRYPRYVLG